MPGHRWWKVRFSGGDSIPVMKQLDEQQRLQIFCAVLQGVAANMTYMAKPEKVVDTAVRITERGYRSRDVWGPLLGRLQRFPHAPGIITSPAVSAGKAG